MGIRSLGLSRYSPCFRYTDGRGGGGGGLWRPGGRVEGSVGRVSERTESAKFFLFFFSELAHPSAPSLRRGQRKLPVFLTVTFFFKVRIILVTFYVNKIQASAI